VGEGIVSVLVTIVPLFHAVEEAVVSPSYPAVQLNAPDTLLKVSPVAAEESEEVVIFALKPTKSELDNKPVWEAVEVGKEKVIVLPEPEIESAGPDVAKIYAELESVVPAAAIVVVAA
jgi:hypothetical protein